MDEPRIESAGLTPIAADLTTINDLTNPDDLPVLDRVSALLRRVGLLPLQLHNRPRPGHDDDCRRRSGRHRPAGSRLLPERRCPVGRASRQVPRARRENLRSGRRACGKGGRRRRRRPAHRDHARRRLARSCEAPRSRQHPASPDDQRAAEADAQLQLAQVRDGGRRAAAADHQRLGPGVSDGLRPADRVDNSGRTENLSPMGSPASVRRDAAEGICRRQLRLLQPHVDRPAGGAAALAPVRRAHRFPSRRGARQSLRRRDVQSAGQSRHACAWCRRSRTRCARTSTRRRG